MKRKRWIWIVLLAVALLASGVGYLYYNNIYLQAQEPVQQETMATYTATRGDLVLTASGSGTLEPASEVGLAFRSSGVLAEMLVKVGDKVDAGQVVARLDDTDARDQLTQAQINFRQAELSLAGVANVSASDLAAAEASLSSAKANLTALTSPAGGQELLAAQQSLKSAKEALADLLDGPDQDTVDSARADLTLAAMSLQIAQAAYDKVADKATIGSSQEAMDLWQATTNYEKAKAEYNKAVAGATEDEISDARAQVAQAQAALDALLAEPDPDGVAAAKANVAEAQAKLDELLAGGSASALEAAQLSVQQAQLDLQSAQRTLANTELVSTVSGTVIAIDAQVGESVGTSAIITVADLEEPQILFWVEESDLTSVAPGNAVNIVFEALPDYAFSGTILRIDPVLATVSNVSAVQCYASVDLSAHPVELLSGMNAEVEVVAGEARNAVLVPLTALRELGTDQYAVFVVQANGEMEMRVVEVGLADYVNAAIVSGLEVGEVVSLGTSTGSATGSATGTEGFPRGEGGFPGGMDGGMPGMGGMGG